MQQRNTHMKSIVIIGSGVGGLAAGIYAQRNGFATTILEAHHLPGGQLTSWNRKGYSFEGSLHYFGGGGGRRTHFNQFWEELGVFPCPMITTKEVMSAYSEDGLSFHDYYDLEKLRAHMKSLSPEDAPTIDAYIKDIQQVIRFDNDGALFLGPLHEKLSSLPRLIFMMKYFRSNLETYATRFKHPLFRKTFPLLHYSCPNVPLYMHLIKHSDIAKGSNAMPVGCGTTIAKNMVSLFERLGGTIRCQHRVAKILTENDRACGVEMEDGEIVRADFVVSNADGRKTIMHMLQGRYVNKKIIGYCMPNPDVELPYPNMVFFGVKRDLSSHPAALLFFLDSPVIIAGHICNHIGMQLFGSNSGMAPAGKGIIKVELAGKPSYFEDLYKNRTAYKAEKERIAEQVLTVLEKKFPGLREDVEVADVATLKTWERYMGGTHGFHNIPNMKFNILDFIINSKQRYTLPGLKNFFFAGQWASAAEVILPNALSGKTVIRDICKQCNVKFLAADSTADRHGRS